MDLPVLRMGQLTDSQVRLELRAGPELQGQREPQAGPVRREDDRERHWAALRASDVRRAWHPLAGGAAAAVRR